MTGCRAFLSASLLLVVAATTASAQTTVTPEEAARFLSQATLGANWEEIHRTADMGFESWLAEQFERPIGYHQPYSISAPSSDSRSMRNTAGSVFPVSA